MSFDLRAEDLKERASLRHLVEKPPCGGGFLLGKSRATENTFQM